MDKKDPYPIDGYVNATDPYPLDINLQRITANNITYFGFIQIISTIFLIAILLHYNKVEALLEYPYFIFSF